MAVSFFTQILDLLESALRLPFYIICSPARFFAELFDHPSLISQIAGYTRYGFGATVLRSRIAHVNTNYASQAVLLESMISHLEDELELPLRRRDRVLLFCLYRDLIHAYFLDGHTEDASDVVIRACRFLGREVLPGFGDLTFNNAQLIKASLSAGRMIDPDSDTTFVVRARYKKSRIIEAGKKRQRKAKGGAEAAADSDLSLTAKVIPFRPRPE